MRRAVFVVVVLMASRVGAQVSIEIGSLTAAPGESGIVDVTIRTTHVDVAGTANGIVWTGPFSFDSCAVNPDIDRSASGFAYTPTGCRMTGDCTSLSSLILSLGIPTLPPPLADGDILYSCQATVRNDAAMGDYELTCRRWGSATSVGMPIDTSCVDGVVRVRVPTPTATVTPTSTLPPPTATATQVPPSATSTAPPATSTPVPCPGDCDANGVVSIDELISAVRIALGEVGVGVCPSVNSDGGSEVSVSELVRAVVNALDGCSAQGATG